MPRTLYCRCAFAQVIPDDVKDRRLEELCASGEPFDAVPDLCEMAAQRDPGLRELAESAAVEGLRIIACHPRAVRGLFRQAGSPLPDAAECVNMRAPQQT
ncbi:MAG TPA: hypothetical protein VMN36_19430 [Verrucomicrobiales bacterium]|nr:hypothetical protein [Verrucomicrobiales bacterium]